MHRLCADCADPDLVLGNGPVCFFRALSSGACNFFLWSTNPKIFLLLYRSLMRDITITLPRNVQTGKVFQYCEPIRWRLFWREYCWTSVTYTFRTLFFLQFSRFFTGVVTCLICGCLLLVIFSALPESKRMVVAYPCSFRWCLRVGC